MPSRPTSRLEVSALLEAPAWIKALQLKAGALADHLAEGQRKDKRRGEHQRATTCARNAMLAAAYEAGLHALIYVDELREEAKKKGLAVNAGTGLFGLIIQLMDTRKEPNRKTTSDYSLALDFVFRQEVKPEAFLVNFEKFGQVKGCLEGRRHREAPSRPKPTESAAEPASRDHDTGNRGQGQGVHGKRRSLDLPANFAFAQGEYAVPFRVDENGHISVKNVIVVDRRIGHALAMASSALKDRPASATKARIERRPEKVGPTEPKKAHDQPVHVRRVRGAREQRGAAG